MSYDPESDMHKAALANTAESMQALMRTNYALERDLENAKRSTKMLQRDNRELTDKLTEAAAQEVALWDVIDKQESRWRKGIIVFVVYILVSFAFLWLQKVGG